MSQRMPLFPLGTVLYPGLMLPLHIFEARYRKLVEDLLRRPEGPQRSFGVVTIRSGREGSSTQPPQLHDVGCLAELRQVEALPEGRYDITTAGTRRFRLGELDTTGPYLVGEIDELSETAGEDAEVLAPSVSLHYQSYRELLLRSQGQPPRDSGELPQDPLVLSYLVAAAMMLDAPDKQSLLEAEDGAARLRAELGLLRREQVMLTRLPSLPGADFALREASPN